MNLLWGCEWGPWGAGPGTSPSIFLPPKNYNHLHNATLACVVMAICFWCFSNVTELLATFFSKEVSQEKLGLKICFNLSLLIQQNNSLDLLVIDVDSSFSFTGNMWISPAFSESACLMLGLEQWRCLLLSLHHDFFSTPCWNVLWLYHHHSNHNPWARPAHVEESRPLGLTASAPIQWKLDVHVNI